ncbi:MAG: 3-deoxy-8-phosphooctulonate synthase [Elusimicrobia bacterium]|nr:3-deoxy-8-phosphooctulonate synthase [Elusimicrobiota bacterium]
MRKKVVKTGDVSFGGGAPFVLIAGPCVIEDRRKTLKIAMDLVKITKRLKVPFVFKASYDKANRTSIASFRGPGIDEGLDILLEVKERLGVPVLSDVHEACDVDWAAEVLDIIQIPAFLCRQTDLVVQAGYTGKVVNVKKGQFLAPWDMRSIIGKIESTKNQKILLTERGVSFGYNNLVTDFTAMDIMAQTGYPVVYDVTHSVQQPGGLGHATGGRSEFVPLLARCGVAAGVDAVFMETHPDPKRSLSDGPNMLSLNKLEPLLAEMMKIDRIVKGKRG